ncbi:dicarboxylate carrier SLC25A8-like [Artemia franciscana]|uniref:dicarboxylate carrier SLC25A8-like n=1 Tax=Artemia franciscana TaxID=6661 RepID=UPI0032DAB77D
MAPITASAPATKIQDTPLYAKLLTAGSAACVADLITFPLDTAKVRLQVQGENGAGIRNAARAPCSIPVVAAGIAPPTTVNLSSAKTIPHYKGAIGTVLTIAREEGSRNLYNGLTAGLQRQMCFASIRIGCYDTTKALYQSWMKGDSNSSDGASIPIRIAAGITTGALAVLVAQPTDVVKVRFQAATKSGGPRYTSTFGAYKAIANQEGVKGLWKGTLPNVTRNAIVNVAEIVCYDVFKDLIIRHGLLDDNIPCHFSAAVAAGFCTTVVASPVDVIKTRYMNSPNGKYRNAMDCTIKTAMKEGPLAFYKGFMPSFSRLVAWNICMWITYEQFKKVVNSSYH